MKLALEGSFLCYEEETGMARAKTVNGVAVPERKWTSRLVKFLINGYEPAVAKFYEDAVLPPDLKGLKPMAKLRIGVRSVEADSGCWSCSGVDVEILK